jgi:hypothetical protein
MMFSHDRIEESKRAMRRKLASLPVGDKLRMLDMMRERAVTLRDAKKTGGRAPVGGRANGVETPR